MLIGFALSTSFDEPLKDLEINGLDRAALTCVTIACKWKSSDMKSEVDELQPVHFPSLAAIASTVVSHALACYENVHLLMACPQSVVLAFGYLLGKTNDQKTTDRGSSDMQLWPENLTTYVRLQDAFVPWKPKIPGENTRSQ